jgi:hypothetical protein
VGEEVESQWLRVEGKRGFELSTLNQKPSTSAETAFAEAIDQGMAR